jgi:hypothetical protein
VLFAAVAVSPARADYSNTVASFNPIGYWRLNETAPPSPPLNVVTNYGSVGSNGNAVVVLNCTKGHTGAVGKSILFDGNAGAGSIDVSAKVDVPFNAALNPAPPLTVEFWANPNRNDATVCAMSSMDCQLGGGGSRRGWLVYLDSTFGWEFRIGTTSGYLITSQCSSGLGATTVGSWQHVVVTYDGATAQIYVNGVLKATRAASGWVPNTEMPIMFGCLPLPGGGGTGYDGPAPSFGGLAGSRGYDGYLDEVAIYTNILSSSTIAAHYFAATTNAAGYDAQILASNPVGYWNFDEPAVTPPNPSTFPIAVNSGLEGSASNGTNSWGDLAGQSGPPYPGMGGAANKACFFDGDNGYIGLLDDPGMHFTNGSGLITMMAWVKPMGSINYYRNIIGHGWDANYIETFLRISQGDNGAGGSAGINYYQAGVSADGTPAGYDANVAQYPIPPGDVGNWVFVAATYDGSAWNLYRNGQLVATTPSAQGAVDVTNRWSIGARTAPSPTDGSAFYGPDATFQSEGLFFNGYIDEPAIFSNALTAANIFSIYTNAQVTPVITRAVQIPPGAYKNATVPFNVWAEGNPTLNYTWTSNGVPTGGNVTNITLGPLAPGPLTVACVVANPYGSATSSVSVVVVASKPLITLQPVPIKRFYGLPFQFSTAAGGTTPISYQWNTNNIPIPGATSPTYSNIVSAATAGSYSCTLSNEAGISNTISVALTAVPVPGLYPGAVYSNSPVAYYRLDEANGSTVCNDYMSGINGIYNGIGTTLQIPGYSTLDPDTAASFSGLNSYVGSIDGTAAGINFPGHTNFTIEAWVKAPAGQNDEATIIAKGIGANGTTRTEQFSLDVASGVYRFFTSDAARPVVEADSVTGPNGTWQHVVGVYDDQNVLGGGSNMFIYVNGVLEGSHKTRPAGLVGTTSPVSIGSKRTGNPPDFDGTFEGIVDEVAIYNYPLSAATIQAHYAAAYGATTPPFINVQPSGVTNYAGLSLSLSVAAAGTQPLTYTWKRDNVALSAGPTGNGSTISFSAGGDTITISDLSVLDSGTFFVAITNSVNPGVTSISVPVQVLLPPNSPPPIPGLVLHLPFDGDLTDATGRNPAGHAIHTTTNVLGGGFSSNVVAGTFVPGMLGQAFQFTTKATTNTATTSIGTDCQYATLGLLPDLQFSSNVNFSVSFWIQLPQGYLGGDLPFFTDASGSEGNQGFVFAPSYAYGTASPNNGGVDPSSWAGCWAFTLYGPGGQGAGAPGIRFYGSDLGAQPGTINDGNFHHLVFVVNRQTGLVTTYLDGFPNKGSKQGGTSLGATDIDSGLPATIGQDPSGFYGEAVPDPLGAQTPAAIDDLGVWRKALTPLEAASIYVAAISNHLSFTSGTFAPLTVTRSGSQLVLSWTSGFMLTTATNLNGPWTDVTLNAPLVVNPNAAKQFYRVRF